jgi:hypothetical protein
MKNVLNKSPNKLYGLTVCAIIVYNMTTSSLYPTHAIICMLSSEFQTQIQPQRPGMFSNASHLLVDG